MKWKYAYMSNSLAIQGHPKAVDVFKGRSLAFKIASSSPYHKRHPSCNLSTMSKLQKVL